MCGDLMNTLFYREGLGRHQTDARVQHNDTRLQQVEAKVGVQDVERVK